MGAKHRKMQREREAKEAVLGSVPCETGAQPCDGDLGYTDETRRDDEERRKRLENRMAQGAAGAESPLVKFGRVFDCA